MCQPLCHLELRRCRLSLKHNARLMHDPLVRKHIIRDIYCRLRRQGQPSGTISERSSIAARVIR